MANNRWCRNKCNSIPDYRKVIFGGIQLTQQLYAYNGTDFVLVGPQDAGSGITQMQSKTVRDNRDISRSVIAATVNDEVIFIISPVEFTINSTDAENAISGFDVVRQGVTLKNTQNATAGVTSTDHRFMEQHLNVLKIKRNRCK